MEWKMLCRAVEDNWSIHGFVVGPPKCTLESAKKMKLAPSRVSAGTASTSSSTKATDKVPLPEDDLQPRPDIGSLLLSTVAGGHRTPHNQSFMMQQPPSKTLQNIIGQHSTVNKPDDDGMLLQQHPQQTKASSPKPSVIVGRVLDVEDGSAGVSLSNVSSLTDDASAPDYPGEQVTGNPGVPQVTTTGTRSSLQEAPTTFVARTGPDYDPAVTSSSGTTPPSLQPPSACPQEDLVVSTIPLQPSSKDDPVVVRTATTPFRPVALLGKKHLRDSTGGEDISSSVSTAASEERCCASAGDGKLQKMMAQVTNATIEK
eukprot:scaffold11033_cov134-Cylindrotheca_fusiformis.AAC.1